MLRRIFSNGAIVIGIGFIGLCVGIIGIDEVDRNVPSMMAFGAMLVAGGWLGRGSA